jgi:exopolyphosphatase/guanosine-5'-triphosphate,3'-diphosphate pyrophosphatase
MAAEMTSKGYRLRLPKGWLDSNPLTRLALEDEAAYWNAVGVSCQYE